MSYISGSSRRTLTYILAVCVFLICSVPDHADAKIKITYGCWGSALSMQRNAEIVKAFQAIHPEIEVEYLIHSSDAAQNTEKLWVQFISGTAPDIVQMTYAGPILDWYESGAIRPIDDLIARDQFPINDFLPWTLHYARYKGQLMGLPRSSSSSSIGTSVSAYNRELFLTHGLPFPTNAWTFMDIVEWGRKLTRDVSGDGNIDQWGVESISDHWYLWAWCAGGEILSENEKTLLLLDNERAIEGLEFAVDLYHEYGIVGGSFARRTAGMALCKVSTTGSRGWFKSYPDLDWAILGNPAGPNSERGYHQVGSHIIGINSTIPQARVDAAWEYMKFLSSPEYQEFEYYVLDAGTPHLRQLVNTARFLTLQNPPWSYAPLLEALNAGGGRTLPHSRGWVELRQTVAELFAVAKKSGLSMRMQLESNRGRLSGIKFD